MQPLSKSWTYAIVCRLIYSHISSLASQDTPVFLPVKSPTVPFRLVSSELSAVAGVGVTVCVLCGPSPSLVEIETELLRNWKTTYNLVASLQSLHPRGFPAQANFDHVSAFSSRAFPKEHRAEKVFVRAWARFLPRSCLIGLPGPVWVLLSKIHRRLFPPLYLLDAMCRNVNWIKCVAQPLSRRSEHKHLLVTSFPQVCDFTVLYIRSHLLSNL